MNRATQNLRGQFKVQQNQTEVARLMGLIKHEHEMAVWAATGISLETARNTYIRHRYQTIGRYREHLSRLVGEQRATQMVQAAIGQATIDQVSTQKQQTTQDLGRKAHN